MRSTLQCLALLGAVSTFIAGCSGSASGPGTDEVATTSVPASPSTSTDPVLATTSDVVSQALVFDEPPEGDDGPTCWVSFADGGRTGGCRTGELSVVEFSNVEGDYVESWNGVVSHVSVPDGWEAYTFHQMWADGEEDNARRQGFVHHIGGTTAAFYQQTFPVIRYVEEYDWQFCRTWNQEVFDAEVVEDDAGTNDTVQCLHFEPDPTDPGGVLVVAADHPPTHERFEISYTP